MTQSRTLIAPKTRELFVEAARRCAGKLASHESAHALRRSLLTPSFDTFDGFLNWQVECEPFATEFSRAHPEYELIGITGSRQTLKPWQLVHCAVEYVYSTESSLAESDDALVRAVDRVVRILETRRVAIRALAPLVGVNPPSTEVGIAITDKVRIVPAGAALAHDLDPHYRMQKWMERYHSACGACLLAQFEIDVLTGPLRDGECSFDHAQRLFDLAVAVLRIQTLQSVGYPEIWLHVPELQSLQLTPAGLIVGWAGRGGYISLSPQDVSELEVRGAQVSRNVHPSFALAVEKLSDAVARRSDQDAILDAAIGLEATLLFDKSKGSERGEKRYRFAMHYAFLSSDPSSRRARFERARKLYDMRSQIVHAGRKPSIREDEPHARTAKEMLKEVIDHFLAHAQNPPYVSDDYWLSVCLG